MNTNLIKAISINLAILLVFLALILLSPPVIYATYKQFKPARVDDRANLEIYQNYDWAEKHFEEFRSLKTTYYDFVVWKRDDFNGETIQIKDGLRRTTNDKSLLNTKKNYAFFGGSTMWGTGSSDEFTIPSQFSRITNFKSYNFGETGYSARQSLASYINFILEAENVDQGKNITNVVFYGGSVDVAVQCKRNSRNLSTQREKQIQRALKTEQKFSYPETFSQVLSLLQKVVNVPSQVTHDCDSNPTKAKMVARTVVKTWITAQQLAQQNGMDFVAVLEPHGYSNSYAAQYLQLDPIRAKQYAVIYPLIKQYANDKNINFIDLSNSLSDCDNCFIDDLHIGPAGNKKIAELMSLKI